MNHTPKEISYSTPTPKIYMSTTRSIAIHNDLGTTSDSGHGTRHSGTGPPHTLDRKAMLVGNSVRCICRRHENTRWILEEFNQFNPLHAVKCCAFMCIYEILHSALLQLLHWFPLSCVESPGITASHILLNDITVDFVLPHRLTWPNILLGFVALWVALCSVAFCTDEETYALIVHGCRQHTNVLAHITVCLHSIIRHYYTLDIFRMKLSHWTRCGDVRKGTLIQLFTYFWGITKPLLRCHNSRICIYTHVDTYRSRMGVE